MEGEREEESTLFYHRVETEAAGVKKANLLRLLQLRELKLTLSYRAARELI